jgi:hypothetical protein
MTSVAAMPEKLIRSIVGFLMRTTNDRGAAVLGVVGLALLGAGCDTRPLTTSPDASVPTCANVGCAAPPLCSAGCQATCGCCACTPGERSGDLLCTSGGCYAPAPAGDGGSDAGGAAVCQLPFEAGVCDAFFHVYAFVDGACVQRTYGGCGGNGNRFSTLEECMATCAGQPLPGGCPPNRIPREICLACGPAGGCSQRAKVCALVCDVDAGASICADSLPVCYEGVCQYAFCI